MKPCRLLGEPFRGCGSAYKLITYLGEFDSVGFDVPETVDFLNKKYPDRKWLSVPFSDRSHPPADLVICSDVIEHVLNPDELMNFGTALSRKWVVLSTPDRDLVYPAQSWRHFGPPKNRCHIREWSKSEFADYVGGFIDVVEHTITDRAQATQMIVGRVRSTPCQPSRPLERGGHARRRGRGSAAKLPTGNDMKILLLINSAAEPS